MVIILGVISTGGIFEVFNKAEAGGRLILFKYEAVDLDRRQVSKKSDFAA